MYFLMLLLVILASHAGIAVLSSSRSSLIKMLKISISSKSRSGNCKRDMSAGVVVSYFYLMSAPFVTGVAKNAMLALWISATCPPSMNTFQLALTGIERNSHPSSAALSCTGYKVRLSLCHFIYRLASLLCVLIEISRTHGRYVQPVEFISSGFGQCDLDVAVIRVVVSHVEVKIHDSRYGLVVPLIGNIELQLARSRT